MKRILVVSGSRADYGLLEWPVKVLKEDGAFEVDLLEMWGKQFEPSFSAVRRRIEEKRPDLMLILGDRFEILAAATAAHLQRVPIAHIGGGDVTEGSYDDAMRDCISRMATVHFVTSTSAMARLSHLGLRNVHLVGNPGIDYIRRFVWKSERPIADPYVVVSYQAETIDGVVDTDSVIQAIGNRYAVWILPNPDRGNDAIRDVAIGCSLTGRVMAAESYAHDKFLNLLAHCDEFIGNSSSMLYEAPELGIKTRMIGKRQRGRTIPWGDGKASERMANILKRCAL